MDQVTQTASGVDKLNTLIRNQERKFNESSRLLRDANERLKKKRKPVQPSGELEKEQSRNRPLSRVPLYCSLPAPSPERRQLYSSRDSLGSCDL
jgi:hypothetical protein